MAENIYPITINFPNGLNLGALKREMPSIWTAPDLQQLNYTVNEKPSGPTGITSGSLRIDTQRDLTAAEESSALAHFQTHAGGLPSGGVLLSHLRPASEAKRTWTYVDDVAQSRNGGVGTIVYSDGVSWKRVSDDTVAVSV